MNPRRFAIMGAALFGTAILVSGVIAAVASFGMADVKNTHAAGIEDHATEKGEVTISNTGSASADTAVTAITETALPDASQVSASETPPVQPAAVSSDLTYTDKEAVSSAKTLDESLPDSSQTLAPETPPDGKEAVTSAETLDECLTSGACIDQYLWSVYQRAPKEDTTKVVERTKVIVKTDGKPQTVVKEFARLVDQDFAWKDPKAAEKAGMSLMEYVIGGMDRDFKLKLYHALRAIDDAGLSPGI